MVCVCRRVCWKPFEEHVLEILLMDSMGGQFNIFAPVLDLSYAI